MTAKTEETKARKHALLSPEEKYGTDCNNHLGGRRLEEGSKNDIFSYRQAIKGRWGKNGEEAFS